MKICWDNLENIKYNKNTGKWYKGTNTYIYKNSCECCNEPFLISLQGSKNRKGVSDKYCSNNCWGKHKITWNTNFFKKNNPESNYFGGYLYADGNIIKTKYSWAVRLAIAESDITIIQKLANLIEKNITIQNNSKIEWQRLCVLQFTGKTLQDDMIKFGVIPLKSKNWIEPNIQKEMIPHFLRGWFDGDGTVRKIECGRQVSLAGNKKAIEWFSKTINDIGFSWNSNIIHMKNTNTYQWYTCGKKGLSQFYNLLDGKNMLRLDRKWEKIKTNKG